MIMAEGTKDKEASQVHDTTNAFERSKLGRSSCNWYRSSLKRLVLRAERGADRKQGSRLSAYCQDLKCMLRKSNDSSDDDGDRSLRH